MRRDVEALHGSHQDQLALVRGELAAAQAEAARLQATLDLERARVAELTERLAPKVPELMVPVRWLKDAPDGGAHVGDAVYRGQGPRWRREMLAPGRHRDVQTAPGDLERMPLGHATSLQSAGYVSIVGAASWRADWATIVDSYRPPRTPEEMRNLAAVLSTVADNLERVEQHATEAAAEA